MTLTIEIPDNEIAIISAISKLIEKAGGSMLIDDDDNLTEAEFA